MQPPGPGADAGVTPKKTTEAYVRWRGSGISWNHAVSTSALGVGADYISSDNQQYTQGLAGTFNYFILEPKDAAGNRRGYSLRATTSLGFDVELTNSDFTTTKHEPILRDIPLSLVLSKPLWKSASEEWSVGLNVNGTVVLPTSPLSRKQGVYLTTSPRVLLGVGMPLLGKDSPYLKGVFVGVSARYDHRFSAAETPTNSDLNIVRQSTTGSLIVSDQLTGRALNNNNARIGGFAFLDEKIFGGHFWFFVSGGAAYQFINTFEGSPTKCDVVIDTGCVEAGRGSDTPNARVATSFGVGINFFPSADWGIGLGYDNESGQLGPDGKWRNPFYSPDAQFSASVILSVDAIYERLEGNVRDEPVIYFGQNKKAPKTPSVQSAAAEAVFF